MMYIGWDGREYEDAEMGTMRSDARKATPCANCRQPTTNRNFTCDACNNGEDRMSDRAIYDEMNDEVAADIAREAEERELVWKYENEIDAIICRAQKRYEYWDLGGGDGPDPLKALERAMERAQERVKELRNHLHIWDEDGYCDICGRDGRA